MTHRNFSIVYILRPVRPIHRLINKSARGLVMGEGGEIDPQGLLNGAVNPLLQITI